MPGLADWFWHVTFSHEYPKGGAGAICVLPLQMAVSIEKPGVHNLSDNRPCHTPPRFTVPDHNPGIFRWRKRIGAHDGGVQIHPAITVAVPVTVFVSVVGQLVVTRSKDTRGLCDHTCMQPRDSDLWFDD
ncbi:hypothetical protein GCM10009425_32550 [Pseudomonas asuensis]|uniref:Uncharacterized protein n=1 Tax=Pseudomonas asuensis TaxID=1825787 RepID=A0ABQ2GXT3_9PSED|nr:hypothetical protein GCM10009425_32550 [Pseudomonas asuensis]